MVQVEFPYGKKALSISFENLAAVENPRYEKVKEYIFTQQKAGIEAGGTEINFNPAHNTPYYSLMRWRIL